ncbi:hypothetical protein FQA39_LY18589 [Lamprigera yunnana]|nr:hypothetical protein FQA39_LY18589 [Lamprigera yunnana]
MEIFTQETVENPLAGYQMGLIYVNLKDQMEIRPDWAPLKDSRKGKNTFRSYGMDDEENGCIELQGGHTFLGKTHVLGPADHVGKDAGSSRIEQQGFRNGQAAINQEAEEMLIPVDWKLAWTETPTHGTELGPLGKKLEEAEHRQLKEIFCQSKVNYLPTDTAKVKDGLFYAVSKEKSLNYVFDIQQEGSNLIDTEGGEDITDVGKSKTRSFCYNF